MPIPGIIIGAAGSLVIGTVAGLVVKTFGSKPAERAAEAQNARLQEIYNLDSSTYTVARSSTTY
ncbi:MAG: hypothetical protein QW112_01910 [Candidatus Micrarchaeia archaeon]